MREAARVWGPRTRRNPAAYPLYATNPLGLSHGETKIALGVIAVALILDIGGVRSQLLGGVRSSSPVMAPAALAAPQNPDANILAQQTGRVARNSSGL